MKWAKTGCWIALFALLAASAYGVARLTSEGVSLILEVRATARETRASAQTIRQYVELQTATLSSPKNQKAIEAAIQTVAVYNGTGRLLNTQVLPRMMRVLDEAEAATESLNALVRNTDKNLNAGLLPNLTATAAALNTTVSALSQSIEVITDKSALTLDDIHSIMADPSWRAALESVADSSKNIANSTASLDEAMKSAPGITRSLEEIAKTSSKYRKAVLLLHALSVVSRSFSIF